MKKYFLILFCSFAFGQASNQMVTFTQAQSLGFGLNPGQSSVNSNECLTKAQALAKYNLDANSMSAYAGNQLVPRSVWVNGGDLEPPSYQFASLNYTGSTCSTLTGTWSGWTDNIGISYYSVFVVNYITGAIEHTSSNLSAATSSYTATGLQGGTLYYYNCRAFDAADNMSTLVYPYTTPPCMTYDPVYNAYQDPCGVQYNNLYQGSDGLYYAFDGGNYNLFTGFYYNFYGPSYDVYNWYEWGTYYIDNGVSNYQGVNLSPCGLY